MLNLDTSCSGTLYFLDPNLEKVHAADFGRWHSHGIQEEKHHIINGQLGVKPHLSIPPNFYYSLVWRYESLKFHLDELKVEISQSPNLHIVRLSATPLQQCEIPNHHQGSSHKFLPPNSKPRIFVKRPNRRDVSIPGNNQKGKW